MAVDSKHLIKLNEVNDNEVTAEEAYFINGTLYVTKKFLSIYYKLNEISINQWEKKGLERSDKGHKKLILYDFDKTVAFRTNMVNEMPKGRKPKNLRGSNTQTADRDMEGQEYDAIELQKKKNEVILQDIKIAEAKGNLVPADTIDKSIAEFGAYFVGFLRNSRITLSRDLEQMTRDDIFAFLDMHYGEFVGDVAKRVNHIQDETVFTIYEEIHQRINDETI